MQIEIDDLTRSQVHALLDEHLQAMYALSPPESVHALDLDKLRQSGIVFWSAWDDQLLLGCGALKEGCGACHPGPHHRGGPVTWL